MPKLVLLRHGESYWNKENIFTGWVDISLTQKGVQEALDAGDEFADIPFDVAYSSELLRATLTLGLALSRNKKGCCPLIPHEDESKASFFKGDSKKMIECFVRKELNERHYGDLQGKNKGEVLAEVGKEQFQKWRRSYSTRPPGGESLEDVFDRVTPFFEKEIVPRLVKGENVFISAHGNTCRAILKMLEGISDEEIVGVEIPTGHPIIFEYEEGIWNRIVQLST